LDQKKDLEKRFSQILEDKRLNISGAVDVIEGKLHFQEDPMLKRSSNHFIFG